MPATETKKNAAQEFMAYHASLTQTLVDRIAYAAKRLARDTESLLAAAPNRDTPEFHHCQINTALHLSRDFAEYAAKLSELEAMQRASLDFHGAQEAFSE